jgi:hypothetical protein
VSCHDLPGCSSCGLGPEANDIKEILNHDAPFSLRDEALKAAREVADPAVKVDLLCDIARMDPLPILWDLLDEASDLAESIGEPAARAAACTKVLQSSLYR